MSAEASALQANKVTPFPTRPPVSRFLLQVDKLESLEKEIILDLHNQTEEQIKETRKKAALLSKTAWRIEIACDAEIVNRATVLPGGRGHKDVTAVGVLSTIAKRAKEVGCTPRTIEKNLQIFNLIQSLPAETNALANATLCDKHFYVAALSAARPEDAVREFAEKKAANPKFRVTDAYRLLEREGKTKTAVTQRVTEAARSPERRLLILHIERTVAKLNNEIIPSCPDPIFADRMYGELIAELKDHLNYLLDQDMADILRIAWDAGYREEQALIDHTGLPPVDVSRVMATLGEEGEFILLPGRTTVWHKVGVPVPRT